MNSFKEHRKQILVLDEFQQFVSKASIQSSVLLPMANTLFESNHYENRTKDKVTRVEDAHLSILAACTLDTYERMWKPGFRDIGFNNRLFIVPGSGQRRFSIPHKIPDAETDALKRDLSILVASSKRKTLSLIPEARDLYDKWYIGQDNGVHTKRLDQYAMRLMMLLAANEGKNLIDADIVMKSIKLVDWQLEVRRQHDPIDADNAIADLEQRVRRQLLKGPMTDRDLKRGVHYERAGIWYYERAIKNLEATGEVEFDKTSGTWILARGVTTVVPTGSDDGNYRQ
jgi:hypothetical protein